MDGSTGISAPVPQMMTPEFMQATSRHQNPKAVADAFETMFSSMLMKQMRQTLETGMFGSDPSDVLGGLFDHFMGSHVAQAGGLGIGEMIRSQLERQPERTHSA